MFVCTFGLFNTLFGSLQSTKVAMAKDHFPKVGRLGAAKVVSITFYWSATSISGSP